MARSRQSQAGISLVELLIYIAIMTMMLLLTSTFGLDIIQNQRRAGGVQRLHQGIRAAVGIMNYDLRSAQSIATSTSLFDTPAGALALVDASGATIRYTLDAGTLKRQVNVNSAQALMPSTVTIEGFTLRYLSHPAKGLEGVQVVIAAHTGIPATKNFYRQTYTTSITLR